MWTREWRGTTAPVRRAAARSSPRRLGGPVPPRRGDDHRSRPARSAARDDARSTSRAEPGRRTEALILSPQGHVEHPFAGVDDGKTFTVHTEPGAGAALVDFLDRMRFMLRVEVATSPRRSPWSCARPGPPTVLRLVPARRLDRSPPRRPRRRALGRTRPYGSRAASRGSVWTPTTGPSRTRWAGSARPVHLDKGCYRGQETVARVHTLGRPPRRLTLLHLDGRRAGCPTGHRPVSATAHGRHGSALAATTSSARSRWRWSSGTSRSTPTCSPTGSPPARRSWSTPRSGCTSERHEPDDPRQPTDR